VSQIKIGIRLLVQERGRDYLFAVYRGSEFGRHCWCAGQNQDYCQRNTVIDPDAVDGDRQFWLGDLLLADFESVAFFG
jgi:hypothetical protein